MANRYFVTVDEDGERVTSVAQKIEDFGWRPSYSSFRFFDTNGDYFTGYLKTGATDFVVKKITTAGIVSYFRGARPPVGTSFGTYVTTLSYQDIDAINFN